MQPLLLAMAVVAAPPLPGAAPAGAGATADELQLLRQSLLPSHRAEVEAATGGLAGLPLYRVQVDIDANSLVFKGDEQIRFPTATPLSELPLRIFDDASYLSKDGSHPVLITDVSCPDQPCRRVDDAEPTLVRVVFNPPLPAHGVAHVNLSFRGIVPKLRPEQTDAAAQMKAQMGQLQNRGGGPTDHGAFGAGDGVLSLTGLFPQVAARTATGFDTAPPSGVGDVASYDLSNYLFSASVSSGCAVIAAGVELGHAPLPDGRNNYSYAAAAVRDFPVFAGLRWVSTTQQSGPVQVIAYTLPGDEASGKKVLDVAAKALKDFSARFGEYPWSTFRVVEQPLTDGAGGIEYPTLVGVASLLYRTQNAMGPLAALMTPQPQLGSRAANLNLTDKILEFAVAHEVAHQWWSTLVGSDPHLHPAVDEPLTQYSASLYLESRRGRAAAAEALDDQVAMNYQMMRQTGEADTPADQGTSAFASQLQYAGVVYGKAPLFFREARKAMGDPAFAAALKRYASRYRFKDAGPEGFLQEAQEAAPSQKKKLEDLFTRWFRESHGDQDLGPLDMSKMLEAATGMKMGAEEKAAMQQMMPALMKALQDGADPTDLLKGAGGGGPTGPQPVNGGP